MKEPGWGTIQHFYTIPYYLYAKFGRWDDILAMKNEAPDLDYPTAMFLYARGLAYLRKGNLKAANADCDALERIASKETLKEVTIWEINSAFDLVQIAAKVLKVEILAQDKKFNQSIALLKEAIAIEDGLNYNEPPDWFFSVRHNLGAVQLDAGLHLEAIKTYNQDLANFPKNGWALKGISLAYLKLGDLAGQNEAENKFNEAWRTSDIDLKSSVIK